MSKTFASFTIIKLGEILIEGFHSLFRVSVLGDVKTSFVCLPLLIVILNLLGTLSQLEKNHDKLRMFSMHKSLLHVLLVCIKIIACSYCIDTL